MTDKSQRQAATAALASNEGLGVDALSNNPGNTPQQHSSPSQSRRPRRCRFYGTKAGCRSGQNCPFLHDTDIKAIEPEKTTRAEQQTSEAAADSSTTIAVQQPKDHGKPQPQSSTENYASRRVQRPVPKAQIEDQRAFQLNQLRRRFKPDETNEAEATILRLKLVPSDPDFPFDIEALECSLSVPSTYPSDKPSIRVTNHEMGRGYQLNVEAGFTDLVKARPNGTLLSWLNALDQQLETLLSKEKADTVKIVVNKKPQSDKPTTAQESKPATVVAPPPAAVSVPKNPAHTAAELQAARSKRDIEVRQLEARLGRLPQYLKSSDGLVYTLPIEPRKRIELPATLEAVKTIRLVVPQLYNLQPCRVQLQGVSGREVDAVQTAFETRCREQSSLSLMTHVNYLAQNMHVMATIKDEDEKMPPPDTAKDTAENTPSTIEPTPVLISGSDGGDRSHIITIPRPPEWTSKNDAESSDTDDSYFSDSESEVSNDEEASETEDTSTQASAEQGQSTPAQRGIMLSFPNLEMYGIELLEVYSVSIEIKCERCKTQMDIQNIKNNAKLESAALRSESCRKCANALSVGYRMDLIHTNSNRAGYLDIDGATVVDLLPSNFIPTCAQCSTAATPPGVVSVRGESTMAVCRKCHGRMTFRIPEVKFLRISAAAVRASRAPPRKKVQKDRLGLTVGEELPKRGRCKHYSKSMRWFRFSCCSKVFPCDRCHDEVSDHPTEHANRMICGFCSREQNYRPEDCLFCHAGLTGKKGGGFWEGGKGTRDPTKMSRKDPRKYKRRPGSKVGPSASSKAGKKKSES